MDNKVISGGKKRYVIYSALTGGYDEILQPAVYDDRFDFVLFMDTVNETSIGVWQTRAINYRNNDNTRVCRFVKTHPESLLPEYAVSVWIDSNVQILDYYLYNKVIELDNHGISISSMWHPSRQCIYDEAFAVVNMMIEHERIAIKWCHELRKAKYPRYNGLCETNVVYRKHSSKLVSELDELWWSIIERHSRRDQLSYNYVLWKMKFSCHYLFGDYLNARNTSHLQVVTHLDTKHNRCDLGKNEAWLIRHCWKHNEDTDKVERLYYFFYSWPFPHFWIFIIGQIYRLIDRVK